MPLRQLLLRARSQQHQRAEELGACGYCCTTCTAAYSLRCEREPLKQQCCCSEVCSDTEPALHLVPVQGFFSKGIAVIYFPLVGDCRVLSCGLILFSTDLGTKAGLLVVNSNFGC